MCFPIPPLLIIMDIELAKTTAISAAREAGKLLNENFQKAKKMSFKGEKDIVTDIDIKAEKIILDLITSQFPDHNILSEEAGSIIRDDSPYLWIIDPIDGTVNYYHRMNPYRVGICLLENKQLVLNVLYDPTKDELYIAQKGKGAFLNDTKMQVSANADIKNSVVLANLSSRREPRVATLKIIEKMFGEVMRMRVYGSSLAQMSYIATGKADAFFDVSIKPWDFLPAVLLIEEAGGKVTDIKGGEITPESTSVIATNGKVHDQILKLLGGMQTIKTNN